MVDPKWQDIGSRLRVAREKKGLSVNEAAAGIGVQEESWKKWEDGQEELPFGEGLSASELLEVDPYMILRG